ncbi:MAG: YaeQ family protein [Methylotenera sp.]|nr:YaeQ family protein [Methylotenera sp.]MSQ00153.1 YaeQ family protein [Methylotenera sp.]
MAIKSTIYKIDLQVSDMDRNYYQQHSLTLAKHPSETDERVMVRLIGFALHANEALIFGKGLSDDEEPDLWQKDLTGAIELWMDVGLPTERDIRKASGRAKQVVVMLYGGRIADMWWTQNSKALLKISNLTVINLPETKELANIATRALNISCTIQDGQIMVGHDGGSLDITPVILKEPNKY